MFGPVLLYTPDYTCTHTNTPRHPVWSGEAIEDMKSTRGALSVTGCVAVTPVNSESSLSR